MSFRPESRTRRALIACTAISLLGVVSALLDYGLSHELLWSSGRGGLAPELARLGSALAPRAESLASALRGVVLARFSPVISQVAAAGATANQEPTEPPQILAASMTPLIASLPQSEAEMAPDVNRPTKADRLALAEVSVPKLIMPEPEPITEGASAALFLLAPPLSSSEAAPEPSTVAAASGITAAIVAGPVESAGKAPLAIRPPVRNPFVTSATASASKPAPVKYGWSDLVSMASMKGGDGEEPPRIFGALTEKEFRARELRCMATAVYFEARDESIRGQIAVGQVIMTRVRSDFYPNTICGVVYQGQWNRNACQFSFACDGHPDAPKEQKEWETALDVAKQVISGKVYLNDIADATHYHAVYVRPDWRREVRRIKQIGGHIFYKAPYVQPLANNPDYQTM